MTNTNTRQAQTQTHAQPRQTQTHDEQKTRSVLYINVHQGKFKCTGIQRTGISNTNTDT